MTNAQLLQVASGGVVALVLAAILLPVADGLGRRARLVKHRSSADGRRAREISYATGVALALGALTGFAIGNGLSGAGGGVLIGGVILVVLGLVDDRSRKGGIPGWVRLGVEVLVGVLVWAAGASLPLAGTGTGSFVVSVALLVALPNAFAALDVMGGVAAAAGAGCGAGLLALGLLAHQTLEATLAAAVLGSCLGFLQLNIGRSRKHLGTGGSLFLGFLIAVTALRLQLPVSGTTSVLAVLACLALPLTDTAVVTLPRFLAARPLWRPGKDHLAHRLSARGMHRRGIVLTHTGAALFGGLAAAVSVKERSPVPAGAALVAFVIGGALLASMRFGERSAPHRVRQALVGGLGVLLALVAVSGAAALLAERSLNTARSDLLQAQGALRSLDLSAATADLNAAAPALAHADHLLSSPLTLAGRLVPGISENFSVATTLARTGNALVGAGLQGVRVLSSLQSSSGQLELPLVNGNLNLAPFQQAAGPAATLDADIARAQRQLDATPSRFLLSPVRSARTQAVAQLAQARKVADEAEAATVLIPDAFGANGSRTWLIGAENNAELRGRGGYMGSLGLVTTNHGQVKLGTFASNAGLPAIPAGTVPPGLPAEYAAHYDKLGAIGAWQNLTMSPSFASGGDALLGMLHTVVGEQANGLVGMDPTALANLLAVTGPITVPGIPVPLSAGNVVSETLNQIYFQYPNDADRHDVLSGVAGLIFQRIVAGGIDPRALAGAIGKSFSGGHLAIYSAEPQLEALINKVGIGGNLTTTGGDYLLVLGQNQGENKMDYYLERQISYRGEIQSDGSEQVVLTIKERNTAPNASSLPDTVGGARADIGLAAGVDRDYLSAMVPSGAVLERASINGKSTTDVDDLPELGKRIFGTYLEVAPGASSTLQFRYHLPSAVVGGAYRLTVQNQAMANPDRLSVQVSAPAGFSFASPAARKRKGDSATSIAWSGRLTGPRQLNASVAVSVLQRLLNHL